MVLWTKRILLFCVACLFASCIKNVNIHTPTQDTKLVINCLFNPDSTWKVFVGTTMPLRDTTATAIIKNARVKITGNGQSIELSYLTGGYYVSDQKPQVGIPYTINISAPGFASAEATDSIPAGLSITSYKFDTIPIKITPPEDVIHFDNEKVNRLVLSIDGISQQSYAQLRILRYLRDDLYYYTITDSTLSKSFAQLKDDPRVTDTIYSVSDTIYYSLEELSSIFSKLQALKNKPILSERAFLNAVVAITGEKYSFIFEALYPYAERKKTQQYLEDLFMPNGIYTDQPPFYNIKDDHYSAFLANKAAQNKSDFLFYCSYALLKSYHGESNAGDSWDPWYGLWVRLFSLSPAAFQYKTTYIKHQLNRGNPFSQPVQVYINIKGGYGIFAGYQMTQVRIY